MRYRLYLSRVRAIAVLVALAAPASAVRASGNVGPDETSPATPLPGNRACAYPAEAQRMQIGGPVLYTAQVQPDGTVKSVDIRQVPAKNLGFEEAVRDCVSKWCFEPAAEETGLRLYEGAIRYHVGGTANDEVWIRALLQALASGWNAESPDAEAIFQVLGGTAPDRQIAGPGSAPSLAEQFRQQRASVGWNIELEPEFEQIRFLRPNVAVAKLPFHHAPRAGATPQADGQLALLEATATKRGEQWTLLGWYPIAGPPSDRRWLAPGIEEPRKLKQVNPSYPALARGARVSASIVLEMQIDPQGKVSSVKILRGHPIFDEAAVEAVQKWEYEPTHLLGVPILVVKTVEMDFSLDEASGRVQEVARGVWVSIPGGRVRLREYVAGFRLPASSSPSLPPMSGKTSAGGGQNLGGLYFDPQGADFTAWINRFKNEVYRNWIVPEAALFGSFRGHVDFEFTIERNGTMSALRLLNPTGTPSLDRAAQNALEKSHFAALPADYKPPRATMQVSFYYNETPQAKPQKP